ncbi:hypothetical protein CXF72_02040 [Psychromonas sp. MB-3u-54]|uniref:DUF2999 domain-containing protein n=1 Tax=Psychromonas sp. MB-3u-54 TaxID=2058319 RepID=UPI000C321F97|nr:DUF2999 domain-containing protein [Psychromonas sp. MB-3u-54]PKH04271.1 hypothetical protein CXF72_02040 [Psychromonas sp. MB-3u-54]
MNPIIQTLKDHNVTDQKISELFEALTQNPLSAMTIIQSLGIPQDKLQPLMMMVMTNPDLIKQAVEELNLDFSKVEAAKERLQESK